MKKTFLKAAAAAAVVAATVALSSVAAFAADVVSFVPADFYTGAYNTDKKSPNKNPVVKDNIEVKLNNNFVHVAFGTLAGTDKTVTPLDGKTFTDELTASGNRTINVTPKSKGTVTYYWYTTDVSKKITINGTEHSASAVNTVTATKYDCSPVAFDIVYPNGAAFLGIDYEVSTAVSSDGILTIVNGSEGTVKVTKADSGEEIKDFSQALTKDTVINVTVTPNDGYAVASFTDSANEGAALNKNVYTFSVDGDRTITITYAKLSKATESITYNLSAGLKTGDNGNGLYALEDMKCDSEGYVAGSSNPTLDGMIPTAGAAIKVVPDADGILLITYKQSASSSKSGRCVESSASGAKQVYDKKFTGNDEIAQIAVTAGNEYYFYANGSSKVKIKNIVFATDTAATKSKINSTADYFCVDNNENLYIIHPVTAEEMDAAKLYLKNGDSAVDGTETTEVYTGVTFGDSSSLESTDFGGSNIYVVKVTNASAENIATTTAFKWGTDTAA